jgi:hypothetical protein
MITKITYKPSEKAIILHTDHPLYPEYRCVTRQTLCQSLDKFAPKTAQMLKEHPVNLQQFIELYCEIEMN